LGGSYEYGGNIVKMSKHQKMENAFMALAIKPKMNLKGRLEKFCDRSICFSKDQNPYKVVLYIGFKINNLTVFSLITQDLF
jgi:hypothetical protein